MPDGSRESLTVLGLLPVWKLRSSFQSNSARETKKHEQLGQEGEPQARGAVRFIVIASTPAAKALWQQIVSAARGLSFLHESISQAIVLTATQRDRLQSIVQDAPVGTRFGVVGEADLATEFTALVARSSGQAVIALPSLTRLIDGATAKRECWGQLVALNRDLAG